MDATLSEAILVMLVGMATVFFILGLVILTGYILIGVLNRTKFVLNEANDSEATGISISHQKVIESAIKQWSGGRSMIKNIKKVDK